MFPDTATRDAAIAACGGSTTVGQQQCLLDVAVTGQTSQAAETIAAENSAITTNQNIGRHLF